jgi:hypothetical protein
MGTDRMQYRGINTMAQAEKSSFRRKPYFTDVGVKTRRLEDFVGPPGGWRFQRLPRTPFSPGSKAIACVFSQLHI